MTGLSEHGQIAGREVGNEGPWGNALLSPLTLCLWPKLLNSCARKTVGLLVHSGKAKRAGDSLARVENH
jgi:hypothetical protein